MKYIKTSLNELFRYITDDYDISEFIGNTDDDINLLDIYKRFNVETLDDIENKQLLFTINDLCDFVYICITERTLICDGLEFINNTEIDPKKYFAKVIKNCIDELDNLSIDDNNKLLDSGYDIMVYDYNKSICELFYGACSMCNLYPCKHCNHIKNRGY